MNEIPETPGQLSDKLLVLAEESSRMGEELADLLTKKPAVWMELRGKYQSDTATERAYEATVNGAKEMWLKFRLKGNDRLSSAIKTKLRIMENEARSIY